MAESESPGKSQAGSYTSLSRKDNEETENDVFLLSKQQESYIKDTTDLVCFVENTPLPDNAIIATLDLCSLYTNIPQEEEIKLFANTITNSISPMHQSPHPPLVTL